MSKSIHSAIKSEYDRRQKASYELQQERKAEVYSKLPVLEDIEAQINLCSLKYSRMILQDAASSEKVVAELTLKLEELKKEKDLCLKKLGYPADYLDRTYTCPKCKDTGFIENGASLEECSCYKQQYIKHLYKMSNMKLIEQENFDTFDESLFCDKADEKRYGSSLSPREYMLTIKNKCLSFVENFRSPDEKNLFFSGPTGVGKTFMCSCIARELINKGVTVLYLTAPVLFNIINEYKTRSFKDDMVQDDSYKNIFDVGLLIIDDLGTEAGTSAKYSELLTVLNTRQMNNLSRPCKTIISTNVEAKDLYEYYDERIASRIFGSFALYRFIGDDIRNIKKVRGR